MGLGSVFLFCFHCMKLRNSHVLPWYFHLRILKNYAIDVCFFSLFLLYRSYFRSKGN